MTVKTVAVMGASGFIGSHTGEALRRRGHRVVQMRAPRVRLTSLESLDAILQDQRDAIEHLGRQFHEIDAVINTAGNPDASSRDVVELYAANAMTAALIACAASRAGIKRLVHVSSAVVQGRRAVLDESLLSDAFSDYAQSKALGERLTLERGPAGTVIYRPPSVHSLDRRVTRLTARIARSPFASVAHPGTSPTPQALIDNVADAVAFLATTENQPPKVVIHPWEGLTTSDLMRLLGNRRPVELPRSAARVVVVALRHLGHIAGPARANARRVEMLWFGQRQATSWLTRAGWAPPAGPDAWQTMGERLRQEAITSKAKGQS